MNEEILGRGIELNLFSNKINIPLLIVAVALLTYFLITLISILSEKAILVGSIYPLYISIGVIVLNILGILASIRARKRCDRNRERAGEILKG